MSEITKGDSRKQETRGFSFKIEALTVIALVFLVSTGVEDLVLPRFGSMFSTYVIRQMSFSILGFSFPCVKVVEWLWFPEFPETSFLTLGLELVHISTQMFFWQHFSYAV